MCMSEYVMFKFWVYTERREVFEILSFTWDKNWVNRTRWFILYAEWNTCISSLLNNHNFSSYCSLTCSRVVDVHLDHMYTQTEIVATINTYVDCFFRRFKRTKSFKDIFHIMVKYEFPYNRCPVSSPHFRDYSNIPLIAITITINNNKKIQQRVKSSISIDNLIFYWHNVILGWD